jgi:hypothetical protein
MDNFDLKRFLVENKITKNSKLHEAPHLDFDPIENPSKIKEPSNTINTEPSPSTSPSPSSSDVFPSGKTNLTVGDIITKDMLIRPNNGDIFDIWNPAKILKVFKFPNSTKGRVVIKFNKDGIDPSYDPTIKPSDYSLMQGHYIRSFPISDINRYTLKPPYRIVLPSSVSTPTSVSTPKSFSPSEPRQNTFSPLEETLNNFNLKKFLVENKITRNSNLFETDDFEFTDDDKDLAAGLGIIELTVGDTITPDMWNEQFYKEFQNINQTIERIKYDDADDGAEEWTDAHGWIVLFKDKRTSPGGFYLDDLNGYLKPEYKIFLPDNLDEQDDDFEFTDNDKDLAARLSGSELNVGDTITPDMWDKQAFEDEDGDLSNYNTTIQDSYLIKDMRYDEGDDEAGADWLVDLRSVTTGKNFGITGTPEELSFLNSILKDKHQIISPEPEG